MRQWLEGLILNGYVAEKVPVDRSLAVILCCPAFYVLWPKAIIRFALLIE